MRIISLIVATSALVGCASTDGNLADPCAGSSTPVPRDFVTDGGYTATDLSTFVGNGFAGPLAWTAGSDFAPTPGLVQVSFSGGGAQGLLEGVNATDPNCAGGFLSYTRDYDLSIDTAIVSTGTIVMQSPPGFEPLTADSVQLIFTGHDVDLDLDLQADAELAVADSRPDGQATVSGFELTGQGPVAHPELRLVAKWEGSDGSTGAHTVLVGTLTD